MKSKERRRRIAQPSDVQPRYGDALDCRRIYGLRGTKLWELRQLGLIRSVLLRTKGSRGKRLYDLRSIEALLAREADAK